MQERLLRLREVEAMTGFKKSSIYNFIQAGKFPNPVKIGKSNRWAGSEVSAWIEQKIQMEADGLTSL